MTPRGSGCDPAPARLAVRPSAAASLLLAALVVSCGGHRVLVGVADIEEVNLHDRGHGAAVLPAPNAPARPAPDLATYPVPAGHERILVPIDGAPARGAGEPLVTMVVFSDFQCPFCQRALATLDGLLSAHPEEIRLYFRHNPLDFHVHARPAAALAVLAQQELGDPGFWRAHDLLFANQQSLERADLERYGQLLALDPMRVRAALDGAAGDARIEADLELGRRAGVRGTPNFFLNGRSLRGAQPFEAFDEIVREEIAIAQAAVASGIPRAELYRWFQSAAHPAETPPREAPSAPPPAPPPTTIRSVPVDGAPQLGPSDALVTIVEFSDFQCPFCRRSQDTLREVVARYGADVRIVFRNFPLPFHQAAMPAAEAAMEAFAQRSHEGFGRMHNLLFENQQSLEPADLERYAAQLRLDLRRFRHALQQHTHQARIQQDIDLGRQLDVSGTPSFFVNGEILVGAQPLDAFVRTIDRHLAAARAAVAGGVPRSRIYQHRTQPGTAVP